MVYYCEKLLPTYIDEIQEARVWHDWHYEGRERYSICTEIC